MTHTIKKSFTAFDVKGLAKFYEDSLIPEDIQNVARAFGIAINTEIDAACLCSALSIQFRAFTESDSDEADDIVAIEYQKLLASVTVADSKLYQPSSVLYPDDKLRLSSSYRPTYHVKTYDVFEHTWEIENIGTQTWQRRKLYLSNHTNIRPRATPYCIDIPNMPPHERTKIAVCMNARGFVGKYECKWIMIDEQGEDCFPNSGSFEFIIDVRFEYERTGKEQTKSI